MQMHCWKSVTELCVQLFEIQFPGLFASVRTDKGKLPLTCDYKESLNQSLSLLKFPLNAARNQVA